MKKVVYIVLACIILTGVIVTLTMGLKSDITYDKNAEINVYIGKAVDLKEIKTLIKEVFPNERHIVRQVEYFSDMVNITIKDKTDEELKPKLEELNTKINEKYDLENNVEEITVIHNPRARLSGILNPYIMPVIISIIITGIYVMIRYKRLGMFKMLGKYILYVILSEATFLSILVIIRFPINRLVIPIGLLIYVVVITTFSFINENKLQNNAVMEKKK